MSRGGPRPVVLILVVGLLLVVVAGLWAPVRDQADAEHSELVQVDGLPDPDTEREALLRWAEQTLAGMCMVEKGFRFWVYWRLGRDDHESEDLAYGMDDPERAAREGFGIGRRLHSPQQIPTSANRDYADGLLPERQAAYHQAFHGERAARISVTLPSGMIATVAAGGCLSRARAELYGELREWLRLDVSWANLDAEVAELVYASSEFRAVVQDWSDCLDQRGWTAADPADLRERIAAGYRQRTAAASQWEQAAALAEAECAQATGLVKTGERLHDEVRSDLVAERSEDWRAWNQMLVSAHEQALQLFDTMALGSPE